MIRISVCMATYNGARYIKEQIQSILPQLGENDELVVSDDGSTDDTISIISSFQDERIHVFKGPAKGHPRFNFENGLKHCRGEYIFLCDQDDIWEPNKVEVFCKYLKDNDLVVSDCTTIDGEGNKTLDSFQELKRPNQYGFWNNLVHNHYLGCCMAFSKDLLKIVLPFPLRIAQHDIWIGLCAEAFQYKIKFIPNKLMRYRRYENNFSKGTDGYSIFYKISYRGYFLYHIIVRKMKRM